MLEYFNRQVMLWGEDVQLSLQNKKIAIIGCGGLGSSIAFALGASGIGEVHLIDFDDVSIHNIHRQIAFKLDDEGKNKASVNADIIKQRSPYVKTVVHKCDFKTFAQTGVELDLIMDATDNLDTRAQINSYAKDNELPWVYGSAEAYHGQVCLFEKASFNDLFKITQRAPAGITCPMVMQIASLQANLALRYLAGLSVKKDFLYYLFFDDEGEQVIQRFSLSM